MTEVSEAPANKGKRYEPAIGPLCPHCGGILYGKELKLGPLTFIDHVSSVELFVEGNPYAYFSKSEATLLHILALAFNRVVTKEFVYDSMYWDLAGDGPQLKTLDVFMCKIRKKLKRFNIPFEISSVWGRGWQLRALEQ